MADTTTHYNLIKPKVGGDNNAWGSSLNLNLDAIDLATLLASTPTVADSITRDALIPAPKQNQRVRQSDIGYELRFDQVVGWRPEGITRATGPIVSVKAKGAKGDGVTSDHKAFLDAKTEAAIIGGTVEIDPTQGGVYYLDADVDLSTTPVRWLGPGGVIKGNAGRTIKLPQQIDAGFYQLFDRSLGCIFDADSSLQKELNVHWFGALGNRAHDDAPAIQFAHDMAYGPITNRHYVNNVALNKSLRFGMGWYLCFSEIQASKIYGHNLIGPGREGCTIMQMTAGQRLFNCDATAYCTYRGISFAYGGLVQSAAPLFDFDFTGTYPGALATQQITFGDCQFNGSLGNGQHLCDIGVSIAKSGGSAQGDTILFDNCAGVGFAFGYVAIGDRAAIAPPAYNALGIVFKGGDIQSCMKYGVYCYGGQIFVDGTSCQNRDDLSQLDKNGCDFYFPIFANGSTLNNVRSESCCLTNAQSSADGITITGNCTVHAGNVNIGGWSSVAAYAQGELHMFTNAQQNGSFAFHPERQSGRPYMVWQGGVSGADGSEPDMNTNDSPYYTPPIFLRNMTVSAASVHVTNATGGFNGSHVGWKVFLINPVTGARDYRTIALVNSGTDVSLDVAPSFTGVNVVMRAGKGVVDGTVIWAAYDFNVIEGSINTIMGGFYQCGRIIPGGFPTRMVLFPRVSRKDAWGGSSPGSYNVGVGNGPHHGIIGFIVGQGNAQLTPIAHPNLNTDLNSRPFIAQSALSSGDGITFDGGDSGWQFVTVGLVRGDGVHFYDGTTQTQHTRNITAVLETLGKVLVSTADTAGIDQYIAPGMGRGTGGGGKTHFLYQPAGATGLTVPDSADAAVVDNIGRWQTLLGTIKGIVTGTIVIGAGGSGTPNSAGAEVYRYQINGAATINAPINAVDGSTLTLEIFNNTAGVLTPTLNAIFLGASAAIGAGKWQTRRFIYDATLVKWKPTGTWSGDL